MLPMTMRYKIISLAAGVVSSKSNNQHENTIKENLSYAESLPCGPLTNYFSEGGNGNTSWPDLSDYPLRNYKIKHHTGR